MLNFISFSNERCGRIPNLNPNSSLTKGSVGSTRNSDTGGGIGAEILYF